MKRTYLVLIITMLLIGFATVATNLVINGTINIGFNKKDFNDGVVFSYAYIDAGTATIDKETEKTLTFETETLINKDEQSILDYDIANKSEQYDANVELNCQLINEDDKDIIKYENTIKEAFKLEAGKTKSGKITITLLKPVIEDATIEFTCNIIATAQPREDRQEYVPLVHSYKETLLHGADPVLEGTETSTIGNKKLIPVEISDEGEVTRADITKEWYDYETKRWANAVILNTGVQEPEIGGEIKEQDIESYFVWIPKYRYKLWNIDSSNNDGPREIEIEFGIKNTTDDQGVSCKTPISDDGTQALSGATGNCNNGEWMTHPAFITMGVTGFWVGKFDVGYKDAKSNTASQVNSDSSSNVIVKPDVYSWTGMTNKNIFNALKNYATNLDSHMIKNTEWGAVAYLSHSEYGINKEVAQNTNSEFKTGCAKNNISYPKKDGFIASTTGNITGIYDLSGGSWERMAAYQDTQTDSESIGKSGFTKQDIIKIGKKYFDVYNQESTQNSYNNRILGDATGELGPFSLTNGNYIDGWYQDYANFVEKNIPWFHRGGAYFDDSGHAGQFNFNRVNGDVHNNGGSRLVLSPK